MFEWCHKVQSGKQGRNGFFYGHFVKNMMIYNISYPFFGDDDHTFEFQTKLLLSPFNSDRKKKTLRFISQKWAGQKTKIVNNFNSQAIG